MMALVDKRCVPCEGGVEPLKGDEMQKLLSQVSGWTVEGGKKLTKTYKTKSFVDSVKLVNEITPVAEAEGHHPDLLVKWGEVKAELYTHAIGGLHENDFILAAKIDRVAQGHQS